MPTVDLSADDHQFLLSQAELEGITIEEYLSEMVDRQRVIVKYKSAVPPSSTKNPNFEAPHRKWGM